ESAPDLLGQGITLREYNRRIVDIYMNKYDNDTKVVAQKLDIGQTTVYRLLKEGKSPE
ncbi:MAG: two-component system response regulator AtoC, partial [Bacteroidia bacterium]